MRIEELKKIKNFFYVETLYSLFICLLLENDLDKNFYFFSSKFNESVRNNLKNKIVIRELRSIRIIDYIANAIFYRVIKLFFYYKSKNKNFYIHDAGKYAQYFFNNFKSKFILVEDGTLNYNSYTISKEKEKLKRKINFSKKLKRRFVYGIEKIYPVLGVSEKIEKIFLTGILPIPDIIKPKVEIINIEDRWEKMSEEKKRQILSIFNIALDDLKKLENIDSKILLLTQPLSEDGIISEEEKINIYREILKERDIKEIFIKEHPREKTNYINEFRDIKVNIIKKDFPVEILLLLNIKFDKVITIFSTAALNFKEKSEIEFIGTKKYPKLLDRFGVLEDNKEQGTRNKEQGTRNKEQGTK